MARHDGDLRVTGLSTPGRFALTMTLALAAMMSIAGAIIYRTSSQLAIEQQEATAVDAVKVLKVMRELERMDLEESKLAREEGRVVDERLIDDFFQQTASSAREFAGGSVKRFEVRYGPKDQSGYLYQYQGVTNLIVPERLEATGKGLLGLIIGVMLAIVMAGAVVAYLVGSNVSKPLELLIEDLRQISKGNFQRRTHVSAGGEIHLLARTIERLGQSLDQAQDAKIELSARENELAVASEVREALLPEVTPLVEGYDLGAAHFGAPQPGGDFYDYIETTDGRVGLLVCGVSGGGVPAALVGAIARSYLRLELALDQDVSEAFRRVNRLLANDVRRGMFVTALYASVHPKEGFALVACAGHKVPLIRYTAADEQIRLVQPEGIALGFDRGPVFDSSLEILKVPIEVGDRIVLSNTGPLQVRSPSGEEFGEKALYRLVQQASGLDTPKMLRHLRQNLERFAENEPFPNDISIVTMARES